MLRNFAGWLVAAALALPFAAEAEGQGIRGIQVAANMPSAPHLKSHSVLVLNGANGEALYQKNTDLPLPIASITKLMTAMVTLDAGLSMDEPITITENEIDRLKNTSSRLAVGTTLPRREMLLLALMSSENRAAAALARSYPGGTQAFVAQMNRKARSIGMHNSIFYDATGLEVRNTATAMDLARMVRAANNYPLIRTFSTTHEHDVLSGSRRLLHYKNSNSLVREGDWDISLQKTGYIQEAGRCMVLQTMVGSQPLIIVLLAANAPSARISDARAIRNWLERHPGTWLAG